MCMIMPKIIIIVIFLILQSFAINAFGEEPTYKHNWFEKDPDKRWILTTKDAELKYDWRKKKAGSENWQYVPKDYTQQYNWRTNTPKLEDRGNMDPKRISNISLNNGQSVVGIDI